MTHRDERWLKTHFGEIEEVVTFGVDDDDVVQMDYVDLETFLFAAGYRKIA